MHAEFLPLRPADAAESNLIDAILRGEYPPGSNLPAERELARLLGVTRPTLREALQRLSRDGWVEIRQGKPTIVKDFLLEGNLLILNALARHPNEVPPDFILQLLEVRALLAPRYFRRAFEAQPTQARFALDGLQDLADKPEAYAMADQALHLRLAALSGNPAFPLILNGFKDFLARFGRPYFELAANRAHSKAFYTGLLQLAEAEDTAALEALTQKVMLESMRNWQAARPKGGGNA